MNPGAFSMSFSEILVFSGLLLASLQGRAADVEPPLPSWEETGLPSQSPGSHFSDLLPENSTLDGPEGFFLGSPGILTSPRLLLEEEGLGAQDLSLFLHGGLLAEEAKAVKADPTPSLALREVSRSALEELGQVPVNEYLIDPQSLMTEMPGMDVERLLQFHASESRIRFYLLVLDRDEVLGPTASLSPLIHRLGKESELCLAVYPLGEPWRARLFVSPAVSQSRSAVEMSDMAEDCIKDAMQVNDAEQQLQRFAVRLSTRLFWLEKALPGILPASAPANERAVLHEVSNLEPPKTAELSSVAPENVPQASLGQGFGLVMLVGGVCFCLRLAWRYRKLRKIRRVWVFPETEVQPRLGGAFSGGAGATVQFGGKTGPPGE